MIEIPIDFAPQLETPITKDGENMEELIKPKPKKVKKPIPVVDLPKIDLTPEVIGKNISNWLQEEEKRV